MKIRRLNTYAFLTMLIAVIVSSIPSAAQGGLKSNASPSAKMSETRSSSSAMAEAARSKTQQTTSYNFSYIDYPQAP